MDANETNGPFILELNNEVSCVADETKEGQESCPAHEETDSDDIPPSVLSYIEISKSRAAACEKLILEELEDEYMESETDLSLEYKTERQTRHCEEIKEEQKRQRERDFEEELKKIKEAEKLRQEEVELMWKRAQEKLNHEMLLQQEQFRNLRRQVEEERRMMEEEQKKMRDEEQKRKKEEEQKRMKEEEQKRMRDEEDKRKKEVELKRMRDEEDKRKMEEEQKRMRDEEDKRMRDEEDKRKMEEEQKRMRDEEDKRKMEEEQKRMRDEEDKRKRDEEQKRMRDEEEQKRMRDEEEQKRMRDEEDKRMRDEEQKRMRDEEEQKRMRDEEEQKRMRDEEDKRMRDEEDKRMRDEEDKRKREEEQKRMKDKEDKRKKEVEQKRIRDEEDKRKRDEEEQKRMRDEEEQKRMRDEEEQKRMRDEEEQMRMRDEEEQQRMRDEDDKRKGEEEQQRMRDEDDKRKREEETHMIETGVPPQHDPEENIRQTSSDETVDCRNQGTRPSTVSVSHVDLPEHTEKRRQAWMKDCIPWSKLRSEQNRRKQMDCIRNGRGASGLPPLCIDSQLQSTDEKSLQEMTTVTLEDLPAYSLSTLAKWTQVQTLTLRRCGLKSLETINQLPQLCFVDVQENDISSVDCGNMSNLRVLKLGRNNLKSIHGLAGAENLDVLDLSHNSISRIAGLRSLRRLQTLSVDHNHLISTKGLRDVHTLLHLSCSHNHLASVEGLENSALLNTLDLRDNILTEPPNLNNHILLRELHLDENSISSLQGLTSCWLPLMQHLSVARNRITQLPSMANSVSLASLDLQFNCLSELQNVCESLEGCVFLREVHLRGNPLQHDSGWRSILQKAVPVLRAIDDQEADSIQQVSLAPGSFQMFCQAQLQQTHDLQQQHSRELSDASSSLDAVNTSCRHFTEALQLAQGQRFAHECGDTTVAAGLTPPQEILDMDITNAEKHTEHPEMESTGKVPPVVPNRCSSWTFEEKSSAESRHDSFDPVATKPKTGSTASKANASRVDSSATKGKTTSSNLEMTHLSNHQSLDLHNTPAVVTQQLWRKYRQECGIIGSVSTAEKGGGRGGDGPSYINSVVHQDYAATVIQASWRGFALRRRLASALAAVTCPDIGEEDTFEEVDVDEFVFDEGGLEKHWTFSFSEDSLPRHYHSSEQPLFLKPPGHFPKPSQSILPPPRVYKSKQTRVPGEQRGFAAWRVSPESSNRSTSPDSTSVPCCLSERLEKTMEEWKTSSHTARLLLKRAKKMKSTMQRQKKCSDPLFRRSSYQHGPVEAPTRPAQHNRNDRNGSRPHFQRAARSRSSSSQSDAGTTVGGAELDLQQAENVERVQQWLHTQAAHPDRDSESVHFLPEISSDILNGGRVQLVDMQADPGYAARRHHVNNSSAAQPCKEPNYPRRNSLGHARNKVPSPQPVTSASSKKERISHREDPVQLSGGWGGGKKRGRVSK